MFFIAVSEIQAAPRYRSVSSTMRATWMRVGEGVPVSTFVAAWSARKVVALGMSLFRKPLLYPSELRGHRELRIAGRLAPPAESSRVDRLGRTKRRRLRHKEVYRPPAPVASRLRATVTLD